MKECYALSVRYVNHILQFFGMVDITPFVTSCSINILIFAIIVKSSSMTIVDMQAFSVWPETNLSTTKSLFIAFELPPFNLQSCSFTRHVTLFTSHCLQLLICVPCLKIFPLSVPIKTRYPDLLLYALPLSFFSNPCRN